MLNPSQVEVTDTFLADLRRREFGRLDDEGETYLDYAGSALHAASQLRAHNTLLESGLFGNPHSRHAASRASSALIEDARRRVLDFFEIGRAHV